MVSLINHLSFLKNLSFPSISTPFPLVGINNLIYLNLQSSHFGSGRLIKDNASFSCSCKGDWESERELEMGLDLEKDILDFMKGSEKPGSFPTKMELFAAGRKDLVDAIVKRGGWLSIGWDTEVNEWVFENGEIENGEEYGKKGEVVRDIDESVSRLKEAGAWGSTSISHTPTFSRKSTETGDEEEQRGVDGILARLEKERNLSLCADLLAHPSSRHTSDDWLFEGSGDVDGNHLNRSQRLSAGISSEGKISNSCGKFSPNNSLSEIDGSWCSLEPERTKDWTIQQASFSSVEYEASRISFNDNEFHEADDAPKYENVANAEVSFKDSDVNGDNSHDDIRTRLQHLELELASTLNSLRSKREKLIQEEGYGASTDMLKLSDALEFQETEIMNAKDRLRSIRAKLAVLEGRMTLAIISAKKTIDEKQRKIDSASRALQLLCTTCVVWPNSASEVFLVGSFDGWTTQRRMRKSSSGVFSVELMLYPGKYEIKFIVDGVWKVDPLRPIVKNNGFENNLLTVTRLHTTEE